MNKLYYSYQDNQGGNFGVDRLLDLRGWWKTINVWYVEDGNEPLTKKDCNEKTILSILETDIDISIAVIKIYKDYWLVCYDPSNNDYKYQIKIDKNGIIHSKEFPEWISRLKDKLITPGGQIKILR